MVTPSRPHRVRRLLAQSATAQHPWASARVVALRACAPTPSKGALAPNARPLLPILLEAHAAALPACASCHMRRCAARQPHERRAQPDGRMPSTPSACRWAVGRSGSSQGTQARSFASPSALPTDRAGAALCLLPPRTTRLCVYGWWMTSEAVRLLQRCCARTRGRCSWSSSRRLVGCCSLVHTTGPFGCGI